MFPITNGIYLNVLIRCNRRYLKFYKLPERYTEDKFTFSHWLQDWRIHQLFEENHRIIEILYTSEIHKLQYSIPPEINLLILRLKRVNAWAVCFDFWKLQTDRCMIDIMFLFLAPRLMQLQDGIGFARCIMSKVFELHAACSYLCIFMIRVGVRLLQHKLRARVTCRRVRIGTYLYEGELIWNYTKKWHW